MAKRVAIGHSPLDRRVVAWLESHGLSGDGCSGYEIKRYAGNSPKLIIEIDLPLEIDGDPVAEVTSIDKAGKEYLPGRDGDYVHWETNHWGPDHRDTLGMAPGKRADCAVCNPPKKEE